MATRVGWAAVLVMVAAALGACSGGQSTSVLDPIEECEAYVAAYRACLSQLGPQSLTDARVAGVRATLDAQARDPGQREGLKKSCAAATTQISTACR